MTVKKVLLTVAISGTAWGALTLSAYAETPLDGLAPVGEAPAAPTLPVAPTPPDAPALPVEPALPELLGPAPEPSPSAPAGVSPEQCVAEGGNVERMEDGSPGYHCEGGGDDGMPVQDSAPAPQ